MIARGNILCICGWTGVLSHEQPCPACAATLRVLATHVKVLLALARGERVTLNPMMRIALGPAWRGLVVVAKEPVAVRSKRPRRAGLALTERGLNLVNKIKERNVAVATAAHHP